MRKKTFSEEQIALALREAETGTPVAEVCRKMGGSGQSFCRWKTECMGMGIAELRRLRQLEEENRKLKGIVADLTLDRKMLHSAGSPAVPDRCLPCRRAKGLPSSPERFKAEWQLSGTAKEGMF